MILVGLSSAACDGDAQLDSCVASFSTPLQKDARKKRLRKYRQPSSGDKPGCLH